ncbi:MAG: phage tail protein [Smithella sp.]
MILSGSGGGNKKKKTSTPAVRAPIEAKDSLIAKNTARIIDVVSEGKIKGLVNGAQSIYLDGTALENPDGTFNFQGITYEVREGEFDQAIAEGFSAVENETQVGVELLANTPVVRTITNPDLNAVRIKIRTPQFTNQNLTTGDIGETQVDFRIEVQPNGGSYALSDRNYNFIQIPGPQTSSSLSKGFRITVDAQVSGVIGSVQSTTFIVEYRAVGSGTWLNLGTRTVSGKIPGSSTTRGDTSTSGSTPSIAANGTATFSATFEVTSLPENRYEYRVVSGRPVIAFEYSPQSLSIKGKTTSPYEVAYRVNLPAGGAPWNVRLTRLTPDSTSAALQNSITWSTFTEIIDAKLIYPDTAYVAVNIDAALFGSEIPTRGYEVEGLEIQIPDNYDPETREYTGLWTGTFQTAYSNNPAWILYDILVNSRYGLGNSIDFSQIDKFALYEIGQYCDELVDDGYGGQEPRFTFNTQITNQKEAYEVVNAITSAFRGMTYWGSGSITAVQDKPSDPVMLVTNANTIDGFSYSGSALKARHSAVIVTWNDPLDAYRTATVVVEDPDLIQRFGWRTIDTVAIGCTSKGQAIRWGKWILETERYETDTVTYKASFDHVAVRPGDIIAVQDPTYANARMGGRFVSVGTDEFEIDDPVTLVADQVYTLSAVLPDGTVEDRTVINPDGETSFLMVDEPFTETPLVGAVWVLSSANLEPRLFRVISMREDPAKNIFEIVALFHDPAKYDRVETGIKAEEPQYTLIPKGPLLPPSNLSYNEYLYQSGPSVKGAIDVSWQNSPDPRTQFYDVELQGPNDTDFKFFITTQRSSVRIEDVQPGLYQFRIIGLDALGGLRSTTLTGNYTAAGLSAPPADVENFNINIINNLAFLTWDPVPDLDLDYYVIKYAANGTLSTWGSSVVLVERVPKGSTSATIPAQSGNFLIKAVDTGGNESINATLISVSYAEINAINVVETLIEDPDFPGLKENVAVSDSGLQLVGSDSIDDWYNIDEVDNFDIGETGELVSEGTYYFENGLDLGDVYTSRLTADLSAFGTDLFNSVDSWPNIDEIENWDAEDPSSWRVDLQVRTTNDDPAGTPSWSEWGTFITGDYTARAFEFRIILRSLSLGVTPVVERLRITIDMPDRVVGKEDLVCTAGGISVVFENGAFRAKPAIAVAGQDMATGDYFVITNQSVSGFDIEFFNSSNVSIERTFDFVAKGYGRVIPV